MKRISNIILSITIASTILDNSLARADIVAAPGDANSNIVINGKTFDIKGGTQAGINLFHSFEKFGLRYDETANFNVSDANTQNILGRVTGGEVSNIYGLLKVTGSNANLYLINPSGIIFGSSAKLDLKGSFISSTANGIKFGNNWFNAIGNNNYVALTGSPGDLVFTMSQPGTIINYANLQVPQNENLVFAGGIVVNQASVKTGGLIVATVPGDSSVTISQPGSPLSLKVNLGISPANLPNNWQLPISSLPQLLTGGKPGNVDGIEVDTNGEVRLTASGLKINNGDVVIKGGFYPIINAQNGILSAEGNLTLVESKLNATQNISLLAKNTVQLQDNINPLLINSGGNLLIQGDKGINIQGFRDSNSLLKSGGNLNLISDGIISLDAKIESAGNFSATQILGGNANLKQTVPSFNSLISSNGDVSFGNYEGLALKVEAKGSITGGDITIFEANPLLTGTDSDIAILKNSPALILRAGVSNLQNKPNLPSTQPVGNTNFSSPAIVTSPAIISVGNINTAGGKDITIQTNFVAAGAAILAAPGQITTGNITAGAVDISSSADIITKGINTAYNNGNEYSTGKINLSSSGGKVVVDYIHNFGTGGVNIKTYDVFQAQSYKRIDYAPSVLFNTPISIVTSSNISIESGGNSFIAGAGVEKNSDGSFTYRITEGAKAGTQVFLSSKTGTSNKFVFSDNTPVEYGNKVSIATVNFDKNSISANNSYTTGAILLAGGNNATLTGSFQDTQLSQSSNIQIATTPRPSTPGSNNNPVVANSNVNNNTSNSITNPVIANTSVANGNINSSSDNTSVTNNSNNNTSTTSTIANNINDIDSESQISNQNQGNICNVKKNSITALNRSSTRNNSQKSRQLNQKDACRGTNQQDSILQMNPEINNQLQEAELRNLEGGK